MIIGVGHKAMCNVKTSNQVLGGNTPRVLIPVVIATTFAIGEEYGMPCALGMTRTESSIGRTPTDMRHYVPIQIDSFLPT